MILAVVRNCSRLRQLAILSAALNHNPTNRAEILARRTELLQAALGLGLIITDEQQQRMSDRLRTPSESDEAKAATKDHGLILAWALEQDVVPAEVSQPFFDHEPSALRFLSGEAKSGTPELRPISWADFFARFDLMNLGLVIGEEPDDYELVKLYEPL